MLCAKLPLEVVATSESILGVEIVVTTEIIAPSENSTQKKDVEMTIQFRLTYFCLHLPMFAICVECGSGSTRSHVLSVSPEEKEKSKSK